MAKHIHEIRDAIHVFARLDSDERKVLDSGPFQRLRHIHQLALTHLVYPGATHKRFEHSLGVMELAERVFRVITAKENVDERVQGVVPADDQLRYWCRVLRMAALCHDIGHLPFSHAAEERLLPEGRTHESLTVDLIKSEEMASIWQRVTPPLRPDDIAKLAVGPKKLKGVTFDNWERILAELIVGDSFGVDRMTDYASHLKAELPVSLHHLVLPKSGASNVVVCLGQWRDSSSRGSSYDQLSAIAAESIGLQSHLLFRDIDSVLDVMTFLDVEKAIVRNLRDRICSTAHTVNADEAREIAKRRQAGHWASPLVPGAADIPRAALYAVYDALVAAADFFALRNKHQDGFTFETALAMYQAYETDLFCFDQLYRHFCEAADVVEAKSWDVLKKLREQVEACYVTWYVTTLAMNWGKLVGPLMTKWRIEPVPRQADFFAKNVQPRMEKAERLRSFVIISDAFRYEAAEELVRELNGTYRFQAELGSQLGVLPSYTALGMASLLPHKTICYKPTGDVLVDGNPTSSLAQRSDILASVDGVAVKAEDLLAMKKDEGRDFISGKRLVYIYHNTVDAVGDSASTEKNTFDAVRKAINELASVVAYIVNNLNGNHIVITADHGFFFTETAPGEPEKSSLPDKPLGTVKAKKRYLLGHKLPDQDGVWHGSTATTADAEGGMEFWIPRGANRFHFTGGARFVHGGAMLQEIVVPVSASSPSDSAVLLQQPTNNGGSDASHTTTAAAILLRLPASNGHATAAADDAYARGHSATTQSAHNRHRTIAATET